MVAHFSLYSGRDKLNAPLATLLQEKFVEWKSCKRARKQPNSQIKILEPTASQKSRISGFWLQKSQSGNPAPTTDVFFQQSHAAKCLLP